MFPEVGEGRCVLLTCAADPADPALSIYYTDSDLDVIAQVERERFLKENATAIGRERGLNPDRL